MAIRWHGKLGARRQWLGIAWLFAVVLHPSSARARQVGADTLELRGRVVAAESGQPLPVTLVTIVGTEKRALADRQGRFLVPALASGEYRVRAEQLGFVTLDTLIRVGPDSPPVTVRLTHRPIGLPAIVVEPEDRGCGAPGQLDAADRAAVAALVEEVQKNGLRYQVLVEDYPFELAYVRTRRYLEDGEVLGARTDTVQQRSVDARWTYEPGRALRTSVSASGDTSYAVGVPPASILSHAAFQRAHCFRYAGMEAPAGAPQYRIDFHPRPDVRGPDLRGSVFLDSASYVIRRANYRFVDLPEDLHFSDVRAEVEYREVAAGLVIPAVIRISQALDNVRFRGERVDTYQEERRLLDHRFLGPAPGAGPPALRRDHSPPTQEKR